MNAGASHFEPTPAGRGVVAACPLCAAAGSFFHRDAARRYFRCCRCHLVFADPQTWPTPDEEKRHYDKHENNPADLGYRRFLHRLFGPLHRRLPPGSRGLDFGCGPGPTLSRMFAEAGHHVRVYDPLYAPDPSALAGEYDFITASEVVEHLHHPGRELPRLWSLLRRGGWLGVMTKRVHSAAAFRGWHYRLDPTHVCFFSLETFAWLARRLGARWMVCAADVVLLQRLGGGVPMLHAADPVGRSVSPPFNAAPPHE